MTRLRSSWSAALTAIVLVVLATAAGACGDDTGSSATANGPTTTTNPGPNPTPAVDPGPNDTSHGPATIEGVVHLDTARHCIVLRVGTIRLDLHFHGYSLQTLADGAAVVGSGGTPLARDGDSMIVAGFSTKDRSSCGAVFAVESLVNVTPR